ncbi:MAG: hypothetical protein K5986_02520 [Clostridium sp.]|uniref:hypothetical protein n=1 Tax=Clostridium sp. DSM 8431 TaxID=1761781 RepID=UPI0008EA396A|nr:hypothetical protein [Clostridium sp. DSM 8431]MCR4943336.1 hypothetical protein [Clostridium sp.]SFU35752.1 hypothetical protein SAMN04487886_101143 [Clostridium sp. DSM 8431]
MYIKNANESLKETFIHEEYIPIEVKWSASEEKPETIANIKWGNLYNSLLEIGVSKATGLVKCIKLVAAEKIFIDSDYKIKDAECENGHPMFEKELLKDKMTIDSGFMLEVHVVENSIILLLSNDEISKYIVSDEVKFGVNKNNELSCIVLFSIEDKDMKWIKNELKYML